MQKDPVQELLLKTSQAARPLCMHESTVRRLVRRGALRVHARTPGGQALLRYADVAAYREAMMLPLEQTGGAR